MNFRATDRLPSRSGSGRCGVDNWSTAAVLPGSAFGRPQRANRIRFSGDPPLRVGCTAPTNDGPIAEPAVRRRLGQRGWRSGSAARADLVIEDLAVPPRLTAAAGDAGVADRRPSPDPASTRLAGQCELARAPPAQGRILGLAGCTARRGLLDASTLAYRRPLFDQRRALKFIGVQV